MSGPKTKYDEKMKVHPIRLTEKHIIALCQPGRLDALRVQLDKEYKKLVK